MALVVSAGMSETQSSTVLLHGWFVVWLRVADNGPVMRSCSPNGLQRLKRHLCDRRPASPRLPSELDDVMEAYLVESRHWSGVAVPRLGGLLSPILRYRSFRTLGLNSPSFFLRGAAVKRLKG